MKWEMVVGLEVHAQLLTKTKIFCGCSTEFGASSNTQVCPVCLGLPGALPVLNKKAVEYAIKVGLSTNCNVVDKSCFARKNYFYPDLPKGYQISQFELPILENGFLEIISSNGDTKKIGITRIHMEEDAGKLLHSQIPGDDHSLIDLNRACVPLIEIVSEPDIRSPAEASNYAKKLREILVCLEVCDGNMNEGSMRIDANVSVRPLGEYKLGTRTEIKNVNSFKFLEQAIAYERDRQIELLEDGGKVVQETRLFDSDKGITKSMRSKEEAHDYRYFPDPDLPPLVIENKLIEKIKDNLPELPESKKNRFMDQYNISKEDAEIICQKKYIADYYEDLVKINGEPKTCSNWIVGYVLREVNKEEGSNEVNIPFEPKNLAEMIELISNGNISMNMAKEIFNEMWKTGKKAKDIVEEKGFVQISDVMAIDFIVNEVLESNPEEVKAFKEGKTKLMGFFVGQVMKKSKGKANPGMVNQIIETKLK